MKKEYFAAALIVLAFFSGLLLTAATSGCDARDNAAGEKDMQAAVKLPESSR